VGGLLACELGGAGVGWVRDPNMYTTRPPAMTIAMAKTIKPSRKGRSLSAGP
jgi:hypothetical protein